MGTSDCNMFIPFYSLFAHDLLVFEETGTRVLEYSLPGNTQANSAVRQYAQMTNSLKGTYAPKRYKYKLRGVDHYVNMHRGLLYKGDIVYLCLGVQANYVLNTPIENIESNPDVTKFTLFINNEFDNSPELKNIRKKVQQMYIDPLKQQGIDIVQTSRVNNWLFGNNYSQPKFRNVVQMMKHLQEEVPKTLLTQ